MIISQGYSSFFSSQIRITYQGITLQNKEVKFLKGAQGTILTNFSKKSFAAFLQWHPEAIHI